MMAFFRGQSQLSFASAAFYFLGGVISLLSLTAYFNPSNPLNVPTIFIGAIAFLASAGFLIAGARVTLAPAILLMCASGALVLLLVVFSRFELRAMASGLLFYTFFIYLAWFAQMWLARVIGYAWLICYCVAMLIKFDADVLQFLTTLILTAAILGELVGTYKHRLERTSITDPLCGIWNKRGFDQLFARTARIVRRTGQPLSVLYFDLDDFKRVNDTQGHREGDRVLREFSAQLEANTRPQDMLARLGGDEFILALPGTDEAQAELMARRLEARVDAAPWSCGWAEMAPGESAEELIGRADHMMLERKRARKPEGAPRAEGRRRGGAPPS